MRSGWSRSLSSGKYPPNRTRPHIQAAPDTSQTLTAIQRLWEGTVSTKWLHFTGIINCRWIRSRQSGLQSVSLWNFNGGSVRQRTRSWTATRTFIRERFVALIAVKRNRLCCTFILETSLVSVPACSQHTHDRNQSFGRNKPPKTWGSYEETQRSALQSTHLLVVRDFFKSWRRRYIHTLTHTLHTNTTPPLYLACVRDSHRCFELRFNEIWWWWG